MDNQDLGPQVYVAGGVELWFAQENLHMCQVEIAALALDHHNEVGRPGGPKLDVNWPLMRQLELAGAFAVFTARNGHGDLAGYVMHVIHRDMHRDQLLAVDDAHYLAPAYRKGFAAAKFIRFIESRLRLTGVDDVWYHTKARLDKSKFFHWLGYQTEDILVRKALR